MIYFQKTLIKCLSLLTLFFSGSLLHSHGWMLVTSHSWVYFISYTNILLLVPRVHTLSDCCPIICSYPRVLSVSCWIWKWRIMITSRSWIINASTLPWRTRKCGWQTRVAWDFYPNQFPLHQSKMTNIWKRIESNYWICFQHLSKF